jgi:ribosome biogenesis GTPase / thiamine phosphate phosphatase
LPAFDLATLGWTAEAKTELPPDLEPARVVAAHRGVLVVCGERGELRVPSEPGAAVGDWVALDGDRISVVLPRRTAIVRNAAGRQTAAQVLAANIDVAFLVTALGADLEPRRLERYLVAVWQSGATPVVVVTKRDLHADALEQALAVEDVAVGVPMHLVSGVSGEGCDDVRAYLRPGVTGVLLGSSGAGKSTLINRFLGEERFRTNAVRADDEAGRHTTTHRELAVLPGGGLLIDTPGLREVQLWSDGEAALELAFADIDELGQACRFADCAHVHEPGCAVLAAVDEGGLSLDRLRSWRKLQRELRWQERRQANAAARVARKQEQRAFARSLREDAW